MTTPLELDAEAMRRLGYRVIDLLVNRIAELDEAPAWQGASGAELKSRLHEPPPEQPRAFEPLLQCLTEDVFPYAGRIDHPRFFAFIPSCPTWPGILGDLLAGGYNIFQGTWLESAGPSQLELVVLDWFKEWLGYPDESEGILVSGGSAANLTAFVCAREARLDPDRRDEAVAYVSAETHSSMERAARIAGFRPEQLRTLATDSDGRFPPESLRAAVEEDLRAGRRPFLAVASAGATSTGAVDALDTLADVCGERGLWLHVDAAYGGYAVLTERGRSWLRGIDRADSITLDPHKWLYQPYEAGCVLVRRAGELAAAFHIMPDYLQDTVVDGIVEKSAEDTAAEDTAADASAPVSSATPEWLAGGVNFADRGLQLTRGARALKIWLSIQYFGVDAFRQAIDNSLDLALHAEEVIRRTDAFELLSPARLGIVCFRRIAGGAAAEVAEEAVADDATEALNAALVQRLNQSGLGMTSSTRVNGGYALRLCIMNHRTTRSDVDRVLDWLATASV